MRFVPRGFLWGFWEGSLEKVPKLSQTQIVKLVTFNFYSSVLQLSEAHSALGWTMSQAVFDSCDTEA